MVDGIPELLAPAGGPAEFNAALAAGADAIYCGYGHTFNARRGASSFDAQTFGPACDRAHLAGARVYVTVNVVVRDDELANALALIRRAWLAGADAFIIQDWGLFTEVKRRWPQIECHVSTQANVHDARGVLWCKERGADRVTLSRELSQQEIAYLTKTGVELETFCHGAICFCYSGVCQLSSSAGDRSANRGACAQPCRLPYDLVDGHGSVLSASGWGRPLCPKDFYSFDDLPRLIDAGVGSLKIEGRLKGADYVHAVVSAYREQLDDIAQGEKISSDTLGRRRTRLKRAFNRDFTNAYLMGTSGNEMMSYERSNNRGELVGEVVGSRSLGSVKVRRGGSGGGRERVRTSRVAEVDVCLDKPVGKGDLLELRPLSDPTQFVTTHAQDDVRAGELLTCRTSRVVERGSLVRVIRSQEALDMGARVSDLDVARKRPVRVYVRARVGEPFGVALETLDGCFRAHATGFVVEPARTRAVTEDDLCSHVGRMGATPFEPVDIAVDLDEGCGMGFSAVHVVRAGACAALSETLLAPYKSRELAPYKRLTRAKGAQVARDSATSHDPILCAVVTDPACARAAYHAGATRIYAPSDELARGTWPTGVIPLLDEVCREKDHERQDSWVCSGKSVAVGNISQLALSRERGAIPEVRPCIPAHNGACLMALAEAGAQAVWLSPELSLKEIERLAPQSPVPLGLTVYGRVRAMTSEHCVLQVADRCRHDCAGCTLRKQKTFLRNDKGDLLPVYTDLQGRSRIFAARVSDTISFIPQLAAMGIERFCADCTLLSPEETERVIGHMLHPLAESDVGTTTGHLLKPVG